MAGDPEGFDDEEFGYVADALYGELRRIWPEEMTKQELLSSSGFSTEEARAGLAVLEKRGQLDSSGGQLKAVVGEGEVDLKGEGEEDSAGSEVRDDVPKPSEIAPPPATPPVPGYEDSYRSHYSVMIAFGQNPGTATEAVVKTAKAIEIEIADRLHQMYPGAIVSAELDAIDRDRPQRIFERGEEDGGKD